MSTDPWKHRSEHMKCKTCMWFAPKGELGRCRRHAPTMMGYPVVYPTDWCGDQKLDEKGGKLGVELETRDFAILADTLVAGNGGAKDRPVEGAWHDPMPDSSSHDSLKSTKEPKK